MIKKLNFFILFQPENILFKTNQENSIIKITDFGFSRRFINDSNEKFYTFCGTEGYFAPEILNSNGHNLKVDCWSLGVILYVMLCGFHPFFQEDKERERENILNAKFEFPSPYWDSISDNAKDLINKLLVLDIERRLSAKEILEHPWLNTQNSREQLPFSADIYNKMTKKFKIVNNLFNLFFLLIFFSVMQQLLNLL
jgi:calcium/calmodulin-dependent protein kinase I